MAAVTELAPGAELAAFGAAIAGCTRCALAQGRTQVVFGSGSPTADLMFVGEAPGFHEDKQGVPFVGAAGQRPSFGGAAGGGCCGGSCGCGH